MVIVDFYRSKQAEQDEADEVEAEAKLLETLAWGELRLRGAWQWLQIQSCL